METPTGTKKTSALSNKTIIIATAIIVAVVIAAAAFIVLNGENDNAGDNTIGYATEAKVMLDQDSLQAAMDEAMANARDGNVGLMYKNDAFSDDGINFECYIANSSANAYDMFLTIYADLELTDQIFLSGLVPPGSGFENIALQRPLDAGDHTVYVSLTQVDIDENGQQVIKNQVMHTMDFHVVE